MRTETFNQYPRVHLSLKKSSPDGCRKFSSALRFPIPQLFVVGCLVLFVALPGTQAAGAAEFAATGPKDATRQPQEKFLGAVKVTFDLQPTSMSFDLPWHFCSVAENGLKFAHFAAETYDPRRWDGQGANASFEPGMDKEGRFARVWIERQSQARIIVRAQYALNNSAYQVAHDDIATDSPYNGGRGDWGEEWFYIYPDGVYARHMRIHTGLAAMSQPSGWFREPPQVVHEFMETVVIGPRGHVPTDDINTSPAVSLFKMFGNSSASVFANGKRQDINYEMPAGPPSDYGDFRDANIMLVHAKSKYRPFTIGLPYGVKVSPYGWEDNRKYPFATWTGYAEPSIGYISPIGHIINQWHFRRTERTLEQVYLHGMTQAPDPQSEIMRLGWSWIAAPELQMPGDPKSPNGGTGKYRQFTYDQTQRAYVLPRKESGPKPIDFSLVSIYDDSYLRGTMWLVNPTIVVPSWNDSNAGITLKLDGVTLKNGPDYRLGFEQHESGNDLVIWIQRTIDLTAIDDHRVAVSIVPAGR